MLKAIIEQMKLGTKLRFSKPSSFKTIFANNHWNLHLARNQQWLIAKLLGKACRIDQQHTAGLASVATGEYIEADAARFKQFAQEQHERSFS